MTWNRRWNENLCCAADGKKLHQGTFVITMEEEYRERWFFRWPGTVVSHEGQEVIVEFMGLGFPKSRTVELPGRALQVIDDPELLPKLYTVSKKLDRDVRGLDFRVRTEPRPSRLRRRR